MKLDLVYTFVDNTDDQWATKYRQYYPSCDPLRHNCKNEILLSLRTVEKYFNWVNRIYILTDQQKFPLDIFSEKFRYKISFVDHRDVIPKEYLPCFNSAVIELFLWKIEGLEECFVYLNDDVFFGRHLSYSDFFTDDRLNQYFYALKKSPYVDGGYGCIYDSSFRLFHKKWPETKDFFPVNGHMAHILNKSICSKIWNDFENDFSRTATYKIRTDDGWTEDRNNFSFLTVHAMELSRLKMAQFVSDMEPVYQDFSVNEYRLLMRSRPKMFCINNITNVELWEVFNRKFLNSDKIFI